jgi:hypothetical protein
LIYSVFLSEKRQAITMMRPAGRLAAVNYLYRRSSGSQWARRHSNMSTLDVDFDGACKIKGNKISQQLTV